MHLGCALGSLRRSDETPALTSVAAALRRFLCIFVRLLPRPLRRKAKMMEKETARSAIEIYHNIVILNNMSKILCCGYSNSKTRKKY